MFEHFKPVVLLDVFFLFFLMAGLFRAPARAMMGIWIAECIFLDEPGFITARGPCLCIQ